MNSADTSLLHLYPLFRVIVEKIQGEMTAWCEVHLPGHVCVLVEGFRTAAYQNVLYQRGRTTKGPRVTPRDGYTLESMHQSSLAGDLAPKNVATGEIDWTPPWAFWDYLGHCARAEGLEAGINFSNPDEDHIQWKESDKATFKLARAWQKTVGLRK